MRSAAKHRLSAIAAGLAALSVAVGVSGCGDDESKADGAKARTAVHTDFDPASFSDSTKIDNEFSPLEPGMQFTYEGRSNRGGGHLPHKAIFTVTGLTKKIDGVDAVTLWDRDINNGKLLEAELAFWAQDDDGNVWLLGEYPEEYDEEGNFEAAPDTWFSGIDGSRAGIMMRGDPQPGTGTYRQGHAPTIGFGDVAFVQERGARECVAGKCYEDVLITDETNPEEPKDGHQLKYYAPGIGNIEVAPGRGGVEREILELTKFTRLSPGALEFANREARRLEKRAYDLKNKVYSKTPPLKLGE
jgi:hypothetical protein